MSKTKVKTNPKIKTSRPLDLKKSNETHYTSQQLWRMLLDFIMRENLIDTIFKDEKSLKKYVSNHALSDLVLERMKYYLYLKKKYIWGARSIPLKKKSNKGDDLTEVCEYYWGLVTKLNLVDPSTVFNEFPEWMTINQFLALIKWVETNPQWEDYDLIRTSLKHYIDKSLKTYFITKTFPKEILDRLKKAFLKRLEYIENQWESISGRKLCLQTVPYISDVLALKSSIPLNLNWSSDLRLSESNSLGHLQADEDLKDENKFMSYDEIEKILNEKSNDKESLKSSIFSNKLLNDSFLSDIKFIRKDDSIYHNYTFPGNLLQGEDLFVDYAMFIPIYDSFVKDDPIIQTRDWISIHALANKTKRIINEMYEHGIFDHIDPYDGQQNQSINGVLDNLIERVKAINSNTESNIISNTKKELRELAGALRRIKEIEILPVITGENVRDYAERLRDALVNMPKMEQAMRRMPTTNEKDDLWCNTLIFPNENNVTGWGTDNIVRPNLNGCMNVPDARWYDSYDVDCDNPPLEGDDADDEKGYLWSLHVAQRNDLRNYVRYLGESFFHKVNSLISVSENIYQLLRIPEASNKLLISEWVASSLHSLSEILLLIADSISIQKRSNDGRKRLALQIILRQYWHPEGYVQGKLVGIKNLMPGQKDVIKRRSFIKTTKDITTVQEFISTNQLDSSQSRRETVDVTKEMLQEFSINANASGDFDILIGSASSSVDTGLKLSEASKAANNLVSESTFKSAKTLSDKREVKIHEIIEKEALEELTSEITNSNAEITANYFYYQLLRQYAVTVQFHDIKPVLLRTREIPSLVEIDEVFLSDHIHELMFALPAQLAIDAQESCTEIRGLAAELIKRRTDVQEKAAAFTLIVNSPIPSSEQKEALLEWREMRTNSERALAEARQNLIDVQQRYDKIKFRLDRVLRHVRENIKHYMQYIWQSNPNVDHNDLLSEEKFAGELLPNITYGLIRKGFCGEEEVFEYTGPSIELFERLITNLISGAEITNLPDDIFKSSGLYKYLKTYYPESDKALIDSIKSAAFCVDPKQPYLHKIGGFFETERVQISQDALVLETFPGKVPLLEGFQLAHRILSVQNKEIQNLHDLERTKDRVWTKEGHDNLDVARTDK